MEPLRLDLALKGCQYFSSTRSMQRCTLLQVSVVLAITAVVGLGCTELRARQHAREGNRLYQSGEYAEAIQEYELAEALYPDLPTVVLNKGLACRQLLVPGGQSNDNKRAVDCALEAFARLQHLRPDDPRGEQLYVQTLFDADRFEQLEAMYSRKLEKDARDLKAIHGLIQVYSRWERWREALKWTLQRARLEPKDAEAQYAAGVLIHNLLFEKGGSGDNAAFDPRPGAKPDQRQPSFAQGDLVNQDRARLADVGLEHLDRALAIRPGFAEAMTYMNLVYRQKALAFLDAPERWQEQMNAAEMWRQRATEQGQTNQKREAPESSHGL
jgi:tetratricopeptide (TPR) repeat protein